MSISNGKNSSDNIENMDWNATGVLTTVRFGSTSSQVSQNSDICRICHCESDPMNPLLTPCYCSGSLKYVHQTCLQQWLTASETNSCELCKFPFIMHTKIKPFNEWRSLDMSGVERRRLFCAVLFHCCAALCVIWSLCVLIERAAEEVRKGQIGWPFWTKLVVVTVGLTGGVVFMYIQCKQYLNLCNRWRARNRILLIQNVPEKVHPPQSPILQTFIRSRNAPISQSISHGNSNSTVGHIQHHIYNNRHSMDVGGPLGSTGSGFASGAGNHYCELQINQHGQIIAANIENSSMNTCDRDWTLDDVSQMSFKPCPQGSGSLTPLPFHENANNHRYSTISNSSNNEPNGVPSSSCSQNIKTNDLNLFKVVNPELSNYSRNIVNATTNIKYPNSAIFLENRDILNDDSASSVSSDQLKLYHRHSTVVPDEAKLEMFIDRNLRRYSDTKLNAEDQVLLNPKRISQVLGPPVSDNSMDEDNKTSVRRTLDPLELNIQEMLENDIRNIQRLNEHRRFHQHSLDNVIYVDEINGHPSSAREIAPTSASADKENNYFSSKRKMFKSLPNLSASSENLLPTKMF